MKLTYKKLIDCLIEVITYNDSCTLQYSKEPIMTEKVEKVIKEIMILIDRATPKKPIMQAMSGFRLYEASVQVCPCCKELITNVWTRAEYKPNYCHYCNILICLYSCFLQFRQYSFRIRRDCRQTNSKR